jgi:hypothetical protein
LAIEVVKLLVKLLMNLYQTGYWTLRFPSAITLQNGLAVSNRNFKAKLTAHSSVQRIRYYGSF